MPQYFSGTNCRASGYAQIGEPLVEARLKLNGVQVAHYQWSGEPDEQKPMGLGLNVVFDSSHFPNGTTIDVVYEVKGDITGWHTQHGATTPPAKNKLVIHEYADSGLNPDGATTVETLMTGLNYFLSKTNTAGWTEAQHFSNQDGANAICFVGHGGPAGFPPFHWSGADEAIHPSDYESNRIAQIGSGIPPYNTGAPSVNFVHIQACNSAEPGSPYGNDFVRACYPYYMAWGGPWMENQAVMAYSVYLRTSDRPKHAGEIWSRMATGKTAYFTQQEFNDRIEDNPGVLKVWDTYNSANPEVGQRDMARGDLHCFYNPAEGGCARVKSVYTGNNVLPIGWYR